MIVVVIALVLLVIVLRRKCQNRLRLADSERTRLYDLLSALNGVFETHEIEYIATGGTCLGAVRHTEMIPWDDDIDICVDVNDIARIRSLFPTNGLRCEDFDVFGLKIFSEDNKSVWIDVFATVPEDGRAVLAYPKARQYWPTSSHDLGRMYPLRRVKFGPTYVYVANEPEEYLDFYFGPSWRTEGVFHGSHRGNERSEGTRVVIPIRKVLGPIDV